MLSFVITLQLVIASFSIPCNSVMCQVVAEKAEPPHFAFSVSQCENWQDSSGGNVDQARLSQSVLMASDEGAIEVKNGRQNFSLLSSEQCETNAHLTRPAEYPARAVAK